MKKIKKIPKFKSLLQEEQFWSTHDSTDYIDYSRTDLGELLPDRIAESSTRLAETVLDLL